MQLHILPIVIYLSRAQVERKSHHLCKGYAGLDTLQKPAVMNMIFRGWKQRLQEKLLIHAALASW